MIIINNKYQIIIFQALHTTSTQHSCYGGLTYTIMFCFI